jgi:hypothetical protein
MKLQIKLSKDEAIAFKNFSQTCQPEGISDEDFLRTVFVAGIETINKQLMDLVQKYAQENKEELAAEGINVVEGDDGNIRLENADVSGAGESQDGVL